MTRSRPHFSRSSTTPGPCRFAPPGEETWDPVEVMRLLTIEGETDAQAILDQLATPAQERLEEVWDRWDTFDQAEFEDQVEEEQAEASAEASAEPEE